MQPPLNLKLNYFTFVYSVQKTTTPSAGIPIKNNSQSPFGGVASETISVIYIAAKSVQIRREIIIRLPSDFPQTAVNTNSTIAVMGTA